MKCEDAQQSIVQYIYGEMSDASCHSLEQHVAGCQNCRGELQAYEALRQAMSLAPAEEPSANFLAQSRVRLDAALDLLPPPSLWMRFETGLFGFFAQVHAAPGMAIAVAVFGLGIGAIGGHFWMHAHGSDPISQVASAVPATSSARATLAATAVPVAVATSAAPVAAAANTASPSVFNVSKIVQHPNTNMVEVHFNTMVPATVEGSIDDPEVQKLLLMAAQNPADPDVRSHSVGLLAAQCKVGHSCSDETVRTALMVALRYNSDPAVRLEALQGLEPYVGQDVRVRDAVLESLMHDPSQPVRSDALQMLEPVQADSSVRMVLQTVSTSDNNPAMREASWKLLQTIPPTE
ncbi:MAG: zf-HC2 domain-containing protein [Acidobacteriaceae bacterium]